MNEEEKIPVALEAIWQSLERIADSLEKITHQGFPVQQSSEHCLDGYHDTCQEQNLLEGEQWWSCGCNCHS